jgi:suppressor of G2 allele of SKP1
VDECLSTLLLHVSADAATCIFRPKRSGRAGDVSCRIFEKLEQPKVSLVVNQSEQSLCPSLWKSIVVDDIELILSFGRQVMSIPEPAASLANQANALFVDEDFDGALDLYNQAITAASNVAELYVSRAALHIKMENFTAAISDANKAISIDPKNSKAYLRKGVACFQMEEYATAKTAFEKGKEIDPETAQFKTWIRKCNAELEEEMAVEETSAAPIAVGAAGGAASNSAPAATSPAPAPVPPPKPVQRFRHDFIQNQTHVTITVYLKGATQENCQVEFESRTLSLDWKISKDDNWQLSFDPLFDEIIPSESTTNYFTTKIEIKLKKKNTGKWDALERKEDEKALDELSEEVSST